MKSSSTIARLGFWMLVSGSGCGAERAPEPNPPEPSQGVSDAAPPDASPTTAKGDALSPACAEVTDMRDLAYDDDSVAKMLAAARACQSDGSLIGRDRAFVNRHFPPPAPRRGTSDQNYYLGDWKGDGLESMAWKQVKILFCFDEHGAVREVRTVHAHQDPACPD